MMLIKNRITKIAGLTVLCAAFSACDHDFEDTESYHSGSADFSKFVSLGDSLTAGYADGALYLSGQENSFPNILAQQFAQVGGGDFVQPLMNDDLGGLLFQGNPHPDFENRLILNGETESPEIMVGTPSTEVFSLLGGAFNNMGVPGAKSFHLAAPHYGDHIGLTTEPSTANPYFARFASSPSASMIEDAANQHPSFFTLWAGNNDILSYATTGGVGIDQTGNIESPATYGSNDITDPTAFAGTYQLLVDAMTASGGKGILINLPGLTTIPFFNTVPFDAIPLDQAKADTLNAAFAEYNGAVAALLPPEEAAQRTITFSTGQNPVLILDETLTDLTGYNSDLLSMRQATPDDLLLLSKRSKIGQPVFPGNDEILWGISFPLEDGDVLIPSEIDAIETARLAYNATIKGLAEADENLLFLDAAALLMDLQDGIDYGTGFVDTTYGTGGAFSLDGVHLTARGYAIIANEIMKTIESGFDANLPAVDPGTFTTIFFK